MWVFVPNSRRGRLKGAPGYRTGSISCWRTPFQPGVDVGSIWLDLGFHPFGKSIRVRNTEEGIATIVAALGQRGVGRVALEAIGGYARKLTAALIEADVTVFLVNPRRIKAFRDAEGLIAKTDRLDASLIARFAYVMADELRPLRDAGQAVLKALSEVKFEGPKGAIQLTTDRHAAMPIYIAEANTKGSYDVVQSLGVQQPPKQCDPEPPFGMKK